MLAERLRVAEMADRAAAISDGMHAKHMFSKALRQVLQEISPIDGRKRIMRVADALVAAAEEGNVTAASLIADRVDGKAVQVHGGDGEGGAIAHAITVTFVQGIAQAHVRQLDLQAEAKPLIELPNPLEVPADGGDAE